MSVDILGYDYSTIDTIVRWADMHDLPPTLLLALGLQESNLNINESTGDNGQSFGVFQLYTVAHGGPPSKWLGYSGLLNSMNEMAARWTSTFNRLGGWEAWLADGVAFQQTASPQMQGSIAWSEPMARRQVSLANAIYMLYLKQQTVPAPPPEPQPCPPLSGEWTLRVGLGQQLSAAAVLVLDGAQSGASVFATVRQTAASVVSAIDRAGGV